jgi:uncharacterized protein YjbI with pentapeptide repeats
MANEQHLSLIRQGVAIWNESRKETFLKWKEDVLTDLTKGHLIVSGVNDYSFMKADLSNADLKGINLSNADLVEVNFTGADLREADLNYSVLTRANFYGANLSRATFYNANLFNADLSMADLSYANFHGAKFSKNKFSGAIFQGCNFFRAFLTSADFAGMDFTRVKFDEAHLGFADFRMADLTKANLSKANLTGADLSGANLRSAALRGTNFLQTNLSSADLTGVDLMHATLIETNISGTILNDCYVYGLSAWNLKGSPKVQSNLIITPIGEPAITVDNIKVAQFIYLIVNNPDIRDVIDTVTSKAVLILGRFIDERKTVLEAIRDELRNKYNLTPILFDFDPSLNQDITDTVTLLARMVRFVIADLTDPMSVQQELTLIAPQVMVAIRPIILKGQKPWSMFDGLKRRSAGLLPIYEYTDLNDLLRGLQVNVIEPAEAKRSELMPKHI